MIRNDTNEHLKVIQYLGAVLGTIGGLIIWEPGISLLALALISGIVLAVDHQILRYQKRRRSHSLCVSFSLRSQWIEFYHLHGSHQWYLRQTSLFRKPCGSCQDEQYYSGCDR